LLTSVKPINKTAVKEFLQGPVVAFSLILAGVLVFLQTFFWEFKLEYLAIFIVLLSVLWFLSSVRLIKRYRNNLRLRFAEIDQERNVNDYLTLPERSENLIFSNFKENNDEKSLYILKFIKSIAPATFFRYIPNYLNPHRKEDIIQYLLKEIKRYDLTQTLYDLHDFKMIKNEELKSQISELIDLLEYEITEDLTYEKMVDIIYSSSVKEKKKIIRLIAENNDEEIDKLLPLVLKDIEPDIVFLSMMMAKNLRAEGCLEIISDYLIHDDYYGLAYDILVDYGELAIPYINELYFSDDINQKAMIRIIRLLGDIDSKNVIKELLDKLDESDTKIKNEAILSLRKQRFKAKGDQANIIMRQIIKAVENCAWNMGIHLKMREFDKNEMLIAALNKEINKNILNIFNLLSLLYNDKKLNYIYNQIEDGNSEILAFAVEMLDFILDEDLKNIIFPLFEYSSYNVKINQLQYYFPVELSQKEKTLKKIIHRENNLNSLWIRACAIYYCLDHKNLPMKQDLAACMFHKEMIIKETAAFVVARNHPEDFQSVMERLDDNTRSDINLSLDYAKISDEHLIIKRIQNIKSSFPVFNEIPDDQLVDFVSAFDHLYLDKYDTFNIPDEEQAPLVWVFEGSIKSSTKHTLTYKFDQGEMVDMMGIPNIYEITAKETSILYVLNRNKLNELLFTNRELMLAYLRFMDNNKIFMDQALKSHYEKVLI